GFDRWLMSPVCNMNSGGVVRPLILSTAVFSVPTTSVFAGLLKPILLSLIGTKFSSPAGAGAAFSSVLRLYDFRTPPCMTKNWPVPDHGIQPRKHRWSTADVVLYL